MKKSASVSPFERGGSSTGPAQRHPQGRNLISLGWRGRRAMGDIGGLMGGESSLLLRLRGNDSSPSVPGSRAAISQHTLGHYLDG